MSEIKEIIQLKSIELKGEIIRLRRHFHQYPELAYAETETIDIYPVSFPIKKIKVILCTYCNYQFKNNRNGLHY